jgi:hypothetical protein
MSAKYCIDCNKQLSYSSKYKNNLRCGSCAQLFRFKNIKNHPRYIDGRTNKKYYCIDCNNEISVKGGAYGNKRCHSCSQKHFLRVPQNHWNYKNGIYFKLYYCIDCNNLISIHGGHYGKGRCKSCARKYALKNPQYHPNWQGGKSFEEYGAEFDSALKEQVRQRDGYKCQICGCSQVENGRQLDCHHIDYNKRNNILKNLISLCKKCHIKTNFNRKYWLIYFKQRKYNGKKHLQL